MPVFNCEICGILTKKKAAKAKFCSIKCSNSRNKPAPTKDFNCDYCGEVSTRKLSDFGNSKTGLRFCSRGCKDLAQRYISGNKVMWAPHYGALEKKLKGDIRKDSKERTRISQHAVNIYKAHNKPYSCYICGYDKFTEVAHIKAVSDFPPDATLGEINSITNLVRLCPNHHKELDLLKLFCLIMV